MSLIAHSSSESKESLHPIEVPFDAHVLPGRGKRLNCLLPVVCAASEDEIEDLLTSVLCQRYILKISLPVVGVSLPRFGTTAKIVVGWTEENERDLNAAVSLISSVVFL